MNRIVLSKEPPKVQSRPQSDRDLKPNGLWYACGDAWEEWVRSEMPEWGPTRFPRKFKIDLDLSGVLKLDTEAQLHDFVKLYAVGSQIRWSDVAKGYSGVEICPYPGGLRYAHNPAFLFVYAWDVASGCIWDPTALLGWTELPPPIWTFAEGVRALL